MSVPVFFEVALKLKSYTEHPDKQALSEDVYILWLKYFVLNSCLFFFKLKPQ